MTILQVSPNFIVRARDVVFYTSICQRPGVIAVWSVTSKATGLWIYWNLLPLFHILWPVGNFGFLLELYRRAYELPVKRLTIRWPAEPPAEYSAMAHLRTQEKILL